MRIIKATPGRIALAASVIATLALAGCAAKTAAPKAPAAPAGTVLEYKMPAGRVLTYTVSEESSQVMDVMGQTQEVHAKSASTFGFAAKGKKDANLLLGVTVDDMTESITGPMGEMSPDMTPVKGKSFDMVLSPLGSEVDASAAEAITYTGPNGLSNLGPDFKLFFPDLPGKPLKAGDTWPSSASADDISGGAAIKLGFQNMNTFEGLEVLDGTECARIKSEVTSTISGSGNQQGMDMTFSGTGKGTDIWYFAVKDGILVKLTSDLTYDMSIAISAAGMTIPVTLTRKSETRLTGKK